MNCNCYGFAEETSSLAATNLIGYGWNADPNFLNGAFPVSSIRPVMGIRLVQSLAGPRSVVIS